MVKAIFLLIFFTPFLFNSCSNNKKSSANIFQLNHQDTTSFYGYLLKPDKRFLYAVTKIHKFFTNEDESIVETKFENNEWVLSYRNVEVGKLPEIPDYISMMELLEKWCKNLNEKFPLKLTDADESKVEALRNHIDDFLLPNITESLSEIDKRWESGEHNPYMLFYAARGLVYLAVQSFDRIEISDMMFAKALAIMALTKSLTQINSSREESLLAYTMDYSASSAKIAATLEDNDPVRLYINLFNHSLKNEAIKNNAPYLAKYLYYMRLAELKKIEPLIEWQKKYLPEKFGILSVYKAALELESFQMTENLSFSLPYVVLINLADKSEESPIKNLFGGLAKKLLSIDQLESIIDRTRSALSGGKYRIFDFYNDVLDRSLEQTSGPFLDQQTLRAFYDGYFYSSFYLLGIHYLDRLSSAPSAIKFAAYLDSSNDPVVTDMQMWYNSLTKSKEGKAELSAFISDLSTLKNIGVPQMIRTFDELKQNYKYGEPGLFKAVKLLIPVMDSRIDHRCDLASIAYNNLLDLKLTEKYYTSVVEQAGSKKQNIRMWVDCFTENINDLVNMVNDSTVETWVKAKTLVRLFEDFNYNQDFICKNFELVINEDSKDWYASSKYAEYWDKMKNYSKARVVLQNWLNLDPVSPGLERISVVCRIAKTYYNENNYQKALEIIKPEIETYKAEAMMTAARIYDKLNIHDKAIELAKRTIDRYPDKIYTYAFLAQLYWQYNMHEDAAKVLKSSIIPISITDWQFEIAEKFYEAFKEKQKKEVTEAFTILVNNNFGPFELKTLAYPFEKAGKHEIAFNMVSELHYGGIGEMEFLLYSYKCLKNYKGKVNAINWLTQHVPPQMLNPVSMILYENKEYELLWELINNPSYGSGADFVWLMRAAAYASSIIKDKSHYQNLLDYCRKNRLSKYDVASAYMIGIATEDAVNAMMTEPKSICEMSYYIGLKAQSDNNYEKASEWYRRCVETGLTNNGEYRWAYNTLWAWHSEGRSFKTLIKKHL